MGATILEAAKKLALANLAAKALTHLRALMAAPKPSAAGLGVGCIVALLSAVLGQNIAYQPDPDWRAPDVAASKPNPLAKRPQAAAGGKKLFLRNCAECHGDDGSGIIKKHSADLLLPAVQEQRDGALFWKITNGNPDRGMPSFSKLPELERWQIVLFLRRLKSAEKQP